MKLWNVDFKSKMISEEKELHVHAKDAAEACRKALKLFRQDQDGLTPAECRSYFVSSCFLSSEKPAR